jgi:hypothetical protein
VNNLTAARSAYAVALTFHIIFASLGSSSRSCSSFRSALRCGARRHGRPRKTPQEIAFHAALPLPPLAANLPSEVRRRIDRGRAGGPLRRVDSDEQAKALVPSQAVRPADVGVEPASHPSRPRFASRTGMAEVSKAS